MWRQAVLFPDPEQGWAGAVTPLVGIPALLRLLLGLQRAGIERVLLASGLRHAEPWLTAYAGQKPLPQLVWLDAAAHLELDDDAPLLAIRWGLLWTPKVLAWFAQSLGASASGKAVPSRTDGLPVLASWPRAEAVAGQLRGLTFAQLAAAIPGDALTLPPDLYCQPVAELLQPQGDRGLLGMVGKPTDRWHVVWVRSWSFPALRWLAQRQATPNQVTLMGFAVAVLACLLMARGGYWWGVSGAVLLYASWVLDCMDGTLARLTFAESAFGQKLDTVLGHLTNLGIFGALIWAVYGRVSLWKTAGAAVAMLGGIMVAYRVTQQEKRLRPADPHPSAHGKLQGYLDKINHRDYAVVIFILALLNSFKIFLWLSLVGVQVFWLIHLWLMRRYQHGVRPE